ncbi:MAG: hypothetical protein R6X22_13830 [Gemmatimonadota bacterium]
MRFPGEETQKGVYVVLSRPVGEAGREFVRDPVSDPEIHVALDDLEHEDQLVGKLTGMGWRLTFVGGGSRTDETRRFYFRRI